MAKDNQKRIYIIRLQNGAFVSAILANGNPDKPVIYTTRDLDWAKSYQLVNAASKASNRVAKKLGRCEVVRIEWDEETREFDLEHGKVVWVAEPKEE